MNRVFNKAPRLIDTRKRQKVNSTNKPSVTINYKSNSKSNSKSSNNGKVNKTKRRNSFFKVNKTRRLGF